MKVQLGAGAPPGSMPGGGQGWRAVSRVLHGLQGSASAFRDDSITTVFPDDCRICFGPMTAWSSVPVCSGCVDAVARLAQHASDGALCKVCGEAMGFESARFAAAMGSQTCTMCRLAPPLYSRAVAFGAYENELREMLHLLKYGRTRSLASRVLGAHLAQTILLLEDDAARDLVVIAVPLFAARAQERGFNQSELLADAALAELRRLRPQWKLTAQHEALERTRDTRELYTLNPRQRRANLRGAFAVAQDEAVRGREVLLIDDILTTGATARECARVLTRAGAAKVWVATLARAQAEASDSVAAFSQSVARWDAPSGSQQRSGQVF
jgi:ComF family protein